MAYMGKGRLGAPAEPIAGLLGLVIGLLVAGDLRRPRCYVVPVGLEGGHGPRDCRARGEADQAVWTLGLRGERVRSGRPTPGSAPTGTPRSRSSRSRASPDAEIERQPTAPSTSSAREYGQPQASDRFRYVVTTSVVVKTAERRPGPAPRSATHRGAAQVGRGAGRASGGGAPTPVHRLQVQRPAPAAAGRRHQERAGHRPAVAANFGPRSAASLGRRRARSRSSAWTAATSRAPFSATSTPVKRIRVVSTSSLTPLGRVRAAHARPSSGTRRCPSRWGWASARASSRRACWPRRARSALPDLDVIAFSWGVPYGSALGDRGSPLALRGGRGGAGGGGPSRSLRAGAGRTVLSPVVAMASHGILDAFTDGGRGVALLWPVSARALLRSGRAPGARGLAHRAHPLPVRARDHGARVRAPVDLAARSCPRPYPDRGALRLVRAPHGGHAVKYWTDFKVGDEHRPRLALDDRGRDPGLRPQIRSAAVPHRPRGGAPEHLRRPDRERLAHRARS